MKNFFSGEEMDKNRGRRWDESMDFIIAINGPRKKKEPLDLYRANNKKEEKKRDKYDFFGWNKRSDD